MTNKTQTRRPTIADIQNLYKAQDEARKGNYNDYYPFWNIPVGKQAVVRFLPDANTANPFGFLLEKVTHMLLINGEKKTVPCLSMYGEDCPICKLSQSYYKAGDKESGKAYWRKKQHLARVLVMEDPLQANEEGQTCEGKVMNVSLNYSLFNIIKDAISGGELETRPDDFVGGTDFQIKKTQQGDYASYVLSRFARKSSDVDPELLEMVESSLIDLSTLLPAKPNRAMMERMLEAALTGSEYEEQSEGEDNKKEQPQTVKPTVKSAKVNVKVAEETVDIDEDVDEVRPAARKAKVTPTPPVDDTEEEEEDDAEAILASLRKRRASKAA